MRRPVREKMSRAVLALLRGPATDDRRLLGRSFTDAELSRLDAVAGGFTAPVAHDEVAERRRRRDQAVPWRRRSGEGRAAP